ncbi:MAG: hypothetical protein ACREO5_10025 [Candidatus Binatia bacterium]
MNSETGKFSQPTSAKDIVRYDAVKAAYQEVSNRTKVKAPLEIALAAQERYGF